VEIIFFTDQAQFRKWLEENHQTAKEVFVGYYKVKSGKQSMTWSESVDQALCFGWIDGIRRSIDEESYQNRFTPRRPNSIWSNVNIRKVEELKKLGLMQPAGLAIYQARKEDKSSIYSFEHGEMEFSPEFEQQFQANQGAWIFFQLMAPSYRKTAKHWVMSAKQEATRVRRLENLMEKCGAGINMWKL
jgi:uncharacterized protein YdeI (YjbR/CyaY-like superfamily)